MAYKCTNLNPYPVVVRGKTIQPNGYDVVDVIPTLTSEQKAKLVFTLVNDPSVDDASAALESSSGLSSSPTSNTAIAAAALAGMGGAVGVFNVKSSPYAASGNNVADDSAAIQSALDAANAAGGGVVFIPPGTYRLLTTLTMRANVCLCGAGPALSILRYLGTGDGISMASTINTNTAVNTVVRDLQLNAPAANNTGAGYVDVAGGYVHLENVRIYAFKYGVIFDQTEIATISKCQFENQLYAGVWLVNGADHTAGANANYTNRITVEECQFNSSTAGTFAIIDDGGESHTIRCNNFNGWGMQIRGAGQIACAIENNYFSVQGSGGSAVPNLSMITFYATTVAGNAATNNGLLIRGNQFAVASDKSSIEFDSATDATLIANHFTSSSTYAIKVTSIGTIASLNNSANGSPSARYSALATTRHFSADVGYAPKTTGGMSFVNTTATTGTETSALLAYYQEGTFVPTLAGDSTAGTTTYVAQTGRYQRIGKMVYFQFFCNWSNQTGTGNLVFGGLPFTCVNQEYVACSAVFNSITYTGTQVAALVVPNTATLKPYQFSSGAAASAVPVDTSASIYVTGAYLAAA